MSDPNEPSESPNDAVDPTEPAANPDAAEPRPSKRAPTRRRAAGGSGPGARGGARITGSAASETTPRIALVTAHGDDADRPAEAEADSPGSTIPNGSAPFSGRRVWPD